MGEPLRGETRRQAVPALRGYIYQVWWSLYAWIHLREEETLFLEGAEDIDVVSKRLATGLQIKNMIEPFSLGGDGARTAIDHFLSVKALNPQRSVRYRYLTTAEACLEREKPFGNIKGVDFWKSCQRTGVGAEEIRAYLLKSERLSSRVRNYLELQTPQEILEDLVRSLEWETASCSQDEIERMVLDQLVYRGESQRVSPSESRRVVNRMLRRVLETAIAPERRSLTKAEYYLLFEEETTVRIPRAEAQIVRIAGVNSAQVDTMAMAAWVLSAVPPSLERIAERIELIAECNRLLRSTGLIVIFGTTGMGKTTLAKQVVNDGRRVVWISVYLIPPESRLQFCRSLALAVPSDLGSGTTLVLDGFHQGWQKAALQEELAHAFFVLRETGVLVLATSVAAFSSRLLRKSGYAPECNFSVPPFKKKEIEDLASRMGAEPNVATAWTGIVEWQTHGHPQLVHAHLASLKSRGWPHKGLAPNEVLATPREVRREQQEVRTQLIAELPLEATRLVHYLSLMGSVFRRDHALVVGEQLAGLREPGLVFDLLVGPWVESLDERYFSLSPLLANAYEAAFTPLAVSEGHSQLARIFAETGSASLVEARTALICAILGRNEEVLGQMSSGVVQNWKKFAKGSVSSRFSLVSLIDLPGGSLVAWCSPESLAVFRLLQYRVASEAHPECCDQIVERWSAEAELIEDSEARLFHQVNVCVTVVFAMDSPGASLKCAFDCLARLEKLGSEVASAPRLSEFLEKIPAFFDEETRKLWLLYRAGMSFFIVASRVETIEDIEISLEFLAALDQDLRNDLLGLIIDEVMDASFIHRAWVNESRSLEPCWEPIIGQLRAAMDRADAWGILSLYKAAAFGIIIIESEYRKKFDVAHNLLDQLEVRLGCSMDLLEKRATVFFVEGRHGKALPFWERVLGGRGPQPHGLLPKKMHSAGLVLSRRKAAISYASIGHWKEAAGSFVDACQWAYTMGDRAYGAALKTDAAYCSFRSGNRSEAVQLLDSALSELINLATELESAETRITLRLITHFLLWLTPESQKDIGGIPVNLAEPVAGYCSNIDRPNELDAMPLMPMDCVVLYLCKVEEILVRGAAVFRRERKRLTTSPIAFVRSGALSLQVLKDFRENNFQNLVGDLCRILVAGSLVERPSLVEAGGDGSAQSAKVHIDRILRISPEGHQSVVLSGFSFDILVSALLCLRLHAPNEERSTVEAWSRASEELRATWPELSTFVGSIRIAESWTILDAKKMLYDSRSPRDLVMLAALAVSTAFCSDAEAVFYAHAVLLQALSQGVVIQLAGREVALCVADIIERDWRRLAGVPALLRTPRHSVPAIGRACDSAATGFRKGAEILTAAEQAVKISLPSGIRHQFRELE